MEDVFDLTVAIPVLNEERNLEACIKSIGNNFAKKIVIIDSGSNDATIKIAQRYGVDVINFSWNGQFPKKRNWYLRNYCPTTKWILFLDADEYLTSQFKLEMGHAINHKSFDGYWLTYTRYFMGKKLKGGYPLKKLALFKVGSGEYEYIEEDNWSKLDMEIHEHPIINGNVGSIKSEIEHQDFKGIAHYLKKHDDYAAWEAKRFIKLTSGGVDKKQLTYKQKIKYTLMKTPLLGILYFFISFIFLGGFLDGLVGLTFAIFKMSYFAQISCRIKEELKN